MKLLREIDLRGFIALVIILSVVGRWAFTGDFSLREVMVNAFMIAVGYYLGSSKGSADKSPAPAPASPGRGSTE